jgi:hypothetical protein
VRLLSVPQVKQSADDSKGAPADAFGGALPGKQDGARQEKHGTDHDSAVGMLPENHPGDAHGGETFNVQQQRRARRRRDAQAHHQQ